jgi:hypothetical protein
VMFATPRLWLQDRHGENALAYRYFTHFLGVK